MTGPVAPTPAPVPAKPSLWARLLKLAKNPALRPFEVWAVRALFAYVAVKLGIKLDHAA